MLARMPTTQEKWAERVRAWRSSGKTAEEFASELDFEASTLRYWASRLKSTAASAAAAPTETAGKRSRTRPTAMIARVVRQRTDDTARVEGAAPTLEVVVGSARIAVRRGFEPEVLRQVVAALGGAR
jgi:hypothetical protein